MKVAYVDSSMILSIMFEEPRHESWMSEILEFKHSFSANLLEAEVRSAMIRESVTDPAADELLERINWIHPNRPLTDEFGAVLSAGYLRGADLWHLACGLYLRGFRQEVEFLTLDRRQLEVAERLGLRSP